MVWYDCFLDCEPKSFWLVARHGFRNPGKDDIIKIKMRGPKIRDAILQNNPEYVQEFIDLVTNNCIFVDNWNDEKNHNKNIYIVW